MLGYVSGAVRVSVVTFVLCGFAYPLALTGVGQGLMPAQANGSLEKTADGAILGSRLIGQLWSDPQWFHGRPSATQAQDPAHPDDPSKTIDAPYNAANTTASNLGPTSKALADRLTADRKALDEAEPDLAGKLVPSDMLTTSGSGLDPDITPANANLQVRRVAEARGVPPSRSPPSSRSRRRLEPSEFSASRASTCWSSILRWRRRFRRNSRGGGSPGALRPRGPGARPSARRERWRWLRA